MLIYNLDHIKINVKLILDQKNELIKINKMPIKNIVLSIV